VLRNVDPEVKLISAIDPRSKVEAESLAATFGLEVDWTARSEPVAFSYDTPLSSPAISGLDSQSESLFVDHEAVLVFGMLENKPKVKANRLVLDPQKPRDLGKLDLDGVSANHLAIVANAIETRAITDEEDPKDGAKSLLNSSNAEVVITKLAARGALVTTKNDQKVIPPWPTKIVWPIGSGDVFAAGFAWAWAQQQMTPDEAARVGSYAASRWCSTNSFDLNASDFEPPNADWSMKHGRVYLAGPFFDIAQRWLVELVRENLVALGGNVFSPLHDVGVGSDEVAEKDLAGLEQCTAILALLDSNDSGTIFEAGWGAKSELPIVFYSEDAERADLKMLRGAGAISCEDISSAVYRAIWASIGFEEV
jgi:hypothetical protein